MGVQYVALVDAWYTGDRRESVGFMNTMGHYLYTFHTRDYFWSIQNGANIGLPLDHTCPSLHGAAHFGSPGHHHKLSYGGTGSGAVADAQYRLIAAEYIAAGMRLRDSCTLSDCDLHN